MQTATVNPTRKSQQTPVTVQKWQTRNFCRMVFSSQFVFKLVVKLNLRKKCQQGSKIYQKTSKKTIKNIWVRYNLLLSYNILLNRLHESQFRDKVFLLRRFVNLSNVELMIFWNLPRRMKISEQYYSKIYRQRIFSSGRFVGLSGFAWSYKWCANGS